MHWSKSKTLTSISISFSIIAYSFILALAISTFVYFRPFDYVDNDNTRIICLETELAFETGPNFIFIADKSIDRFNESKIRKLCGLNIIKDYNNQYPTPTEINYKIQPAIRQESSWLNALFAFFLTLIIGVFIFELAAKSLQLKTLQINKYIFGYLNYILN